MDIAEYMSKVKNFARYKDSVKFKFVECDLLNDFNPKFKNATNTISCGNIFAYEPKYSFYPEQNTEYTKKNQLIKYLNEKYDKII